MAETSCEKAGTGFAPKTIRRQIMRAGCRFGFIACRYGWMEAGRRCRSSIFRRSRQQSSRAHAARLLPAFGGTLRNIGFHSQSQCSYWVLRTAGSQSLLNCGPHAVEPDRSTCPEARGSAGKRVVARIAWLGAAQRRRRICARRIRLVFFIPVRSDMDSQSVLDMETAGGQFPRADRFSGRWVFRPMGFQADGFSGRQVFRQTGQAISGKQQPT